MAAGEERPGGLDQRGGNGDSSARLPGFIEEKIMRLDKFLKVSRLIKRRTVANEACDGGRVSVNGTVAKASREIKPGDILEIRFGARTTRVEVLTVSETVSKEAAPAMYREI